jgi:hypothetical protein
MTDTETASYLRSWVETDTGSRPFSWPTDACGYEQHIRFVRHRNKNWKGGSRTEFMAFVLKYADSLKKAVPDA